MFLLLSSISVHVSYFNLCHCWEFPDSSIELKYRFLLIISHYFLNPNEFSIFFTESKASEKTTWVFFFFLKKKNPVDKLCSPSMFFMSTAVNLRKQIRLGAPKVRQKFTLGVRFGFVPSLEPGSFKPLRLPRPTSQSSELSGFAA